MLSHILILIHVLTTKQNYLHNFHKVIEIFTSELFLDKTKLLALRKKPFYNSDILILSFDPIF